MAIVKNWDGLTIHLSAFCLLQDLESILERLMVLIDLPTLLVVLAHLEPFPELVLSIIKRLKGVLLEIGLLFTVA